MDNNSNTPLHLTARAEECTRKHSSAYGCISFDSLEIVRELVQLNPAALEVTDEFENTPFHLAARFSNRIEIVQYLASLIPIGLVTMNRHGVTSYYGVPELHKKLPVLLEAAPHAARQ